MGIVILFKPKQQLHLQKKAVHQSLYGYWTYLLRFKETLAPPIKQQIMITSIVILFKPKQQLHLQKKAVLQSLCLNV